MNSKEIWRSIPGYEEVYEVSNLGRVRRCSNSFKCKNARLLKPLNQNCGYINVALSQNGKVRNWLVHKLVLLAFVGPSNGLWTNHKNGNKKDNRLENLEYCTPSENLLHAYEKGLQPSRAGEGNGKSRLTDQIVREMRQLYKQGHNVSKLAKRFGVGRTTVYNAVHRISWTHIEG